MTAWRNYGAGVLVSTGVLITGILVYDYYPTGETTAELAGAAWERAVVSRLIETNSPALWYAPGAISTNEGGVTTNYTGMAAVSPYMRNDQIRYFLDQLRGTMQRWESEDRYPHFIWWLDPAVDPDDALVDGVLTSYATPQYEESPTGERWGSGNAGDGYYPTGGVLWVRSGVATNVTVTPNLFTLNSFVLPGGNVVSNLSLFGWDHVNYRAGPDGKYAFAPTAVFPADLAYIDDLPRVSSSAGYGSVNLENASFAVTGSFWLSAGLHDGMQWQLQNDETLSSGTVSRASWVSKASYALGKTMAEACVRTLNIRMPEWAPEGGPIHTSYTVTERWINEVTEDPDWKDRTTVTEESEFPDERGDAITLAEAYWTYDKRYMIFDASGIITKHYELVKEGTDPAVWVSAGSSPGMVYTSGVYDASDKYTRAVKITNAILTYPSEFAITNGLVSRVRVYAVYRAYNYATKGYDAFAPDAKTIYGDDEDGSYTYTENDWWPQYDGISVTEHTWTKSSTVLANNTGYRYTSDDETDYFGMGVNLQRVNAAPAFVLDEITRQYHGDADSPGTSGLSGVRVTKILDLQPVSSYPVVIPSLGADSVAPPASADYIGTLDGTVTRTVSGDVGISEDGGSASERNGTSTTTETWTRKRVGRELEMAWEVLVVVDWNWDHMNPDTPFVPETFTPGWLK